MAGTDDDSMLFPQKLMTILSEPENHESISWLPNGQAFVIRDRKLFADTVMPRYFSRKAQYSSFTRKLNRWNFTRVSSGPELGAYHHAFFLRDQPHLAAQMFCKNARTMLAMASASPAPTEKIASRPSFPSVPVPVQHWPANSESLLAVEAFPSQNKTSTTPVHSAPATLAPFENVVTLELLERQMAFMQQQKAQANRLLIERAMIMQQQLQREQVNHAQLLSRLGLAQAPPAQPAAPRQPSNNRASAA